MKEHITLGSSPVEEDCVQTTDPDYGIKARAECSRYRDQLYRLYAAKHAGRECPVRLVIASQSHDYGTYYEVDAVVNTAAENAEQQYQAAYWLEANQPMHWDTETENS